MSGDQSPMPSAVAEKIRVQQHYEASQQDEQSESPAATPGPYTESSTSGNTSNAHPFELDSSAAPEVGIRPRTPPPYSGPSSGSHGQGATQSSTPRGPQKYPGLPQLDYRLYSPPLFELSPDTTSVKSAAPYLSANVTALVSLVRAQSTVPPKPQIHITGQRGRKVDFAVKLNLMALLVPEDPRKKMDYIRCVGHGEVAMRGGPKPSIEPDVGDGGLEEWARRFVEDQNAVKSFTLERIVANMDVEWLEGQIRSMVASTGYKGVVNVTFPVTHAKVTVKSPDRVNKFFTSVTTLFSGKRTYEVVKSVWPFATHKNGVPERVCMVQSEETWWREWKDPIKWAVATKRQGWVTNEDKLEALMEGVGKGVSTVDWGPEEY